MKTTFIYHYYQNLPLEATLYESLLPESKGTILYFHGGGLIYGSRDDLPHIYLDLINQTGYSLLALNYPLAPEVKINGILSALEEGILKLAQQPQLKEQNMDRLIYFGRSAGAYLAIQLANSTKLTSPDQLISFYGYYSLNDPLLNQPSHYYQTYQTVPFMTIHGLISKTALSHAPIEKRFPVYMGYRQTGTWLKELLGRKNTVEDFSLTHDDLKELPPTFIAASSSDQDVPFTISQEMSQIIPENTTYFIENLPHDFDSDLQNNVGLIAYQQLLTWLNTF